MLTRERACAILRDEQDTLRTLDDMIVIDIDIAFRHATALRLSARATLAFTPRPPLFFYTAPC